MCIDCALAYDENANFVLAITKSLKRVTSNPREFVRCPESFT